MSVIIIFWTYIILFGIVGAVRGWVKEWLVVFSVILAISLNQMIRRYIPLANNLVETDISLFWTRTLILVVLAYFGYQTVASIFFLASRAARWHLRDALFGAFMGGTNGYLIAGSFLYYYHVAGYPFQNVISKPINPNILDAVNQMMLYMPPHLLGEPAIYFAVIVTFIVVLRLYI